MHRFAFVIVLVWVVSCATPAPSLPVVAVSPTPFRGPSIFSTVTRAPGASPTPAATATRSSDLAELILRWESGVSIADIDDVSEIAIHLKDRPGIVGAFGDEIQITIIYDPKQTNPEAIRRILSDMGYPARSP